MTRIPLRKLSLGGKDYFWQVRHRHHPPGASLETTCAEIFSAFDGEVRRSVLRVVFSSGRDHRACPPGASGVIVDYRDPSFSLNLHRPRSARFLIETALAAGWSPSLSPRSPHLIADGYELLSAHRAALDLVLLESGDPPEVGEPPGTARLPDDGVLFQDYSFEVGHVRHSVIEELVALVLDDRGDMEPTLLYIKVRGQTWQMCFLDVGAGMWQQWSHIDPTVKASDEGVRSVDYAERFGLRGAAILGVYCDPEGVDLASGIRFVLATGTLALRPQDPRSIDPTSYATFAIAGSSNTTSSKAV